MKILIHPAVYQWQWWCNVVGDIHFKPRGTYKVSFKPYFQCFQHLIESVIKI